MPSRLAHQARPVWQYQARPDFVTAAPTLTTVPWLRLPPASPDRYDGQEMKVSHLHPVKQRLVAHHSPSDRLGTAGDDIDWRAQIDSTVVRAHPPAQSPARVLVKPARSEYKELKWTFTSYMSVSRYYSQRRSIGCEVDHADLG